MTKFVAIAVSFIIASCSTIEHSKPVFDKYTYKNITEKKPNNTKEKIGKIAVVLQNKRGKLKFTPDIIDILSTELKTINLFTDVYFYKVEDIDIWTIDEKITEVKKEGVSYLLLISYYDSNSVGFNTFHSAFKTATFNFYDLIPIFSIGVGRFNHYYTATLEATLVNVESNLFIDNVQASFFIEKFKHGGNKTKTAEDIYNNDVFKLAALKLITELKKQL